ncbi:MAG: type II toxin-antitoxin system VapC family toxin [Blastocatellia bacterium]
MTYLLDTNVCIVYLARKYPLKVHQKLASISSKEIALCSIVKAEIIYGTFKGNYSPQTVALRQSFLTQFVSLPFDDLAAEIYGQERARLAKFGQSIGPNDLMIAAIALANNLTLVTHNTREFSRVANLQIEDWEL